MTAEAMVRHAWWSLRGRFWLALVVVIAHAFGVAFVFGRFGDAVPADWEMTAGDRRQVESVLGGPYGDYLRETWAGGGVGGVLAVLAIAMAVGGVAAERRQGTADLTFSLPASRSAWLLARGGLCAALLLLLACVSAIVVAVGGRVTGSDIPIATVATAALLAGLGPSYAVALALAATTLTRDAIGAAVLALGVLWILDGWLVPGAWRPSGLFDVRAWAAGPPWRPLLVVVSLTGSFLLLAIRRFERIDP